jgi:Ser/Thr protein kinase RdoA (MazF antagonist)
LIQEQERILAAFSCESTVAVTPLGCGNINATYLVKTTPEPFVLQQISGAVFPDPVAVMDNFEAICSYLRSLEPDLRSGFMMSKPVYTKNGCLFFTDSSGGYWRAQRYVNTASVSRLDSIVQARSVGKTLARFHSLFQKLHLGKIKDPLPGFHHLHIYLRNYDRVEPEVAIKTDENTLLCRDLIASYREQALTLEVARKNNSLSLQLIHGDPKVDNFIFNEAGDAVGLLDLDTVGAGVIYHDLGDCLRSACSTSQESAGNNVQPKFDLQLCRGILEGYFSHETLHFDQIQPDLIYDGLFAICFELGVRFYTDHSQGNVYFRVEKDGDNADRAVNQFRLCQDIAEKENEIRQLVESLCKTKSPEF